MATFLATWERPGQLAVTEAWRQYQATRSLRDALEGGLAACELSPVYLAIGLGSLPNADGELELDAAMMDGDDMASGAVCAMRGVVPAISVARKVMETTEHVMVAGDQARRFAINHGFRPRQLMTAKNTAAYEDWLAKQVPNRHIHTEEELHADTVAMIGFEAGPRFVAAASTSGMAWKLPGRVGDTPIVGAGIYADNEIGAAGATGHGEELWKAVASYRTVEAMRRGLSPQEACEETIEHMIRRQPKAMERDNVVFAINRDGEVGAAINFGRFHLWRCVEGAVDVLEFKGLRN